jgi:hypothetical protein
MVNNHSLYPDGLEVYLSLEVSSRFALLKNISNSSSRPNTLYLYGASIAIPQVKSEHLPFIPQHSSQAPTTLRDTSKDLLRHIFRENSHVLIEIPAKIVILSLKSHCNAAQSYCKDQRSSKAAKKRQPVIPMCKIEKRKPLSDRWGCDHVLIKVEICSYFREGMKKDDEDRRCSCSEEFCLMKDWEERIEHGSWYRRVRACSKYN